MEHLNIYTCCGNVCTEPDLRVTANGFAILTLRVAINNSKKVGDEWQEVPFFITCKMFGKRAEGLSKIVQKGSFVNLSGSLWISEWQSDGVTRKETECHVEKIVVMNRQRKEERESKPEPMEAGGLTFYDEDVPF